MQKIHNEIRRVDAGILAAVRQQVIFFLFFPDRKQTLSLLICCHFLLYLIWVPYIMLIQQLGSQFSLMSFDLYVH